MTFYPHYLHSLCLGSDWDNTKEDVNVILVCGNYFLVNNCIWGLCASNPIPFAFSAYSRYSLVFRYCWTPSTQYCFQLKLYCFTGSWNRPKNCDVVLLAEKNPLLCCALFCHPNIVLRNIITAELLSNIYFYWENSILSVVAWCYHLIIFSFLLYDEKLQFNEVYI